MVEKKRNLPVQHVRAEFLPTSVNAEKRTVEVVWTTGAKVIRSPMWDEPYNEELSLKPEHVRMDFLNSGKAPLLSVHGQWSLDDVIGVVEKAWLTETDGRAIVRFSEREAVADVWKDVQAGILKGISVGYRVFKFERQPTQEGEKVPTYLAVDWEPKEISLVPIGADDGATVRSDDRSCECVFINKIAQSGEEVRKMENEKKEAPAVVSAAPVTPNVDEVRSEATAAERKRVSEIQTLCRKFDMSELEGKLINDGVSLDKARAQIIDELARKDQQTEVRTQVSGGELNQMSARREGVENAILHRFDSKANKLSDAGREFRGMSILEMGRSFLEASGVKTRGMSKMELASVILGMPVSGFRMQSTSDFAEILANVAGKTLRQAYESAPRTFDPIVRPASLPDFKQVSRVSMGGAPKFEKVLQGGEIKRGTIGEGAEKYQLATFAKIVAITRQVIINDDLDAFTRIPQLIGREAADLVGDLVWEIFTLNAAMADGTALFHADHGNLGTAGAPSDTTLGEMRKLMRLQKGLNGRVLNLSPAFLIGPAALETKILQLLSKELLSTKSSDVNTFKGTMSPIIEPRLDAASAGAWYGAASPGQIDTIELGYLDGNDGVYIETRQGFEVDGVEVKGRLDVAAKAIDFRGLFKNAG